MIKLRLQTFQLCTDMTHNAIPFHAIVMKVEQPPQQSPGNESIRVDSCCMRVLRKKKNNSKCRLSTSIYPQQSASAAKQNTKCIAITFVVFCDVMNVMLSTCLMPKLVPPTRD
jgi:hypothetical protein